MLLLLEDGSGFSVGIQREKGVMILALLLDSGEGKNNMLLKRLVELKEEGGHLDKEKVVINYIIILPLIKLLNCLLIIIYKVAQ